jgi:hypothetical protein
MGAFLLICRPLNKKSDKNHPDRNRGGRDFRAGYLGDRSVPFIAIVGSDASWHLLQRRAPNRRMMVTRGKYPNPRSKPVL